MKRVRKFVGSESHIKLFVGNLPCNASEEELYNIFARYGDIVEIYCLGATGSRSGQACAFVKYLSEEAGRTAVFELHGKLSLRPYENPDLLLQVRPARSQMENENSYTAKYGESHCMDPLNTLIRVKIFIGNLPRDATAAEVNRFMASIGIQIYVEDTIVLSGKVSANNAVSAFVFASTKDDASRAITLIDGRRSLRVGGPYLRASVAHGEDGPKSKRYIPDQCLVHPSSYGSGSFLLPTPAAVGWTTDPSLKTYQHYMLMPQSSNYGPSNVSPGPEPWRTNGVYSLPRASFTQPYIGHSYGPLVNTWGNLNTC